MSPDERSPSVLVVDDEPLIRTSIADRLTAEGFAVTTAASGPDALRRHADTGPDVVILDVMLPGIDGLEVCRRIQALTPTPVLMLTARSEETDLVIGLGVGADDYLAKPFSMRELVARTRALLRRAERYPVGGDPAPAGGGRDLQVLDDLSIDHDARLVTVDGSAVHLTRTEFDLLATLARHPGAVRSRSQLLESVWQWTDAGETRTVDSHIRSLRAKVGAHRIRTVHGVGYALAGGHP
ncbi:response regulator transcription factor [Williamsia deligens]|uniref:Response regulator transcription factor n=1 Tax=Williamsia deligens TaxID=321325 RepID=A0ABW3G1G6_9NOCA|nr:response regulator transcription factor [Williamsia deligens]MCP2194712.1 DNA-binding response regulator, OmpR family, contains REC and winged-helix (wHTH) domain [Williamsia deligens]